MFPTKMKIVALLMLTILFLAAGIILIPRGAQGDDVPAPTAQKVLKELLEKRLTEAKAVWAMKWQRIIRGTNGQPSDLFGWSERLLEAEMALLDRKDDRIKALKAHADRTREVERIATAHAKQGIGRDEDAHTATYERINAEIRYVDVTRKAPPPEKKD
jgi:hypothetical protein